MNKTILLLISGFLLPTALFINSCKKDVDGPATNSKVYTEEFESFANLSGKGWVFKNNSTYNNAAFWQQGQYGVDKYNIPFGFPAYSYKNGQDEYVYASYPFYTISPTSNSVISSWMISPVFTVANGDKLSFYTRSGATIAQYADRLQVRMNENNEFVDVGNTAASVGDFTLLLKDINDNLTPNGYPVTWTQYEITITGLSAARKTRFAFRYYPDSTKSYGVGIDKFEFTKQ